MTVVAEGESSLQMSQPVEVLHHVLHVDAAHLGAPVEAAAEEETPMTQPVAPRSSPSSPATQVGSLIRPTTLPENPRETQHRQATAVGHGPGYGGGRMLQRWLRHLGKKMQALAVQVQQLVSRAPQGCQSQGQRQRSLAGVHSTSDRRKIATPGPHVHEPSEE